MEQSCKYSSSVTSEYWNLNLFKNCWVSGEYGNGGRGRVKIWEGCKLCLSTWGLRSEERRRGGFGWERSG